jgi:cytoskeletal protein RodZ
MFAVPIAIVVLWLAGLSAQVGVVWPNYEAEQKKADQAEKGASEEKSKKAKSEQGKKPASKNRTHEAPPGGADVTP